MDDLLTVKQAAILIKVHHLTIRRYIADGKLKAVKVGGNVRISEKELRDFTQAYNTQTKTAKAEKATPPSTSPFAANDSLFRLKGRGVSLDKF